MGVTAEGLSIYSIGNLGVLEEPFIETLPCGVYSCPVGTVLEGKTSLDYFGSANLFTSLEIPVKCHSNDVTLMSSRSTFFFIFEEE